MRRFLAPYPKGAEWARCDQDGCIGVRLTTTTRCLTHAAEQAPDVFDAELTRIRKEGTVDARGVVISADLLERVLTAAKVEGHPTLAAARFDGATFQGQAQFREVRFRGDASFREAAFQGQAQFDGQPSTA